MAFSGKLEDAALKSAHARYAAHAAACAGYVFQSLDGADGYLFEVSDGARRAVFASGAGTPYVLNDARAASIARDKAFSATVLRRNGVAVLDGKMFFVTPRWREMRAPGREPDDALAYVRDAALPVFCKPIAASSGQFAERIDSVEAFENYLQRVSREHFAILIQPYIQAVEHRVFVLNGRVLFSYRKSKPSVIGDGVRTLAALIEALPKDGSAPHSSARNAAGACLAGDIVLARGEHAWLDGPANRAVGGGAEDLREGARDDLARIALAATQALGLGLAGVDMFDLGAGTSIIEVNSNPMIATLEDHDRWDLIEVVWRANIEAALK